MEMRYSLFAVLLTVLGLHGSFRVQDATWQKYAGGRAASGYGTKYEIVMVAKTKSDKLQFDKLWVGNNAFDISAYAQSDDGPVYFYQKGDKIYIKTQNHIQTDRDGNIIAGEKSVETPPKEIPEGGALLEYYLVGKKRYKKIKQLRELPQEMRP